MASATGRTWVLVSGPLQRDIPVVAAAPPEAVDTIRLLAPAGVVLRPIPERSPRRVASLSDVQFLVLDIEGADDLVAHLADLPHLRVVQTLVVGTDWVEPALPAGVTLCSAHGTRDEAVAEWVLAALSGYHSGLLDAVRRQGTRSWDRRAHGELSGRRVVVVGMGAIGTALSKRLVALGVEVEGVARRARPGIHAADELAALVPDADALVLVAPLNEATRKMVDAGLLARLRDGALVVNAARGALVDTAALTEELARGRLVAVLDAVDPEPLPPHHPLWTLPGAFISPHIAGASAEGRSRAWHLAGEQLARFVRGEPLRNVVRPGST